MSLNEIIRRLNKEEKEYRKVGDLERAGHTRGVANTLVAILWDKEVK